MPYAIHMKSGAEIAIAKDWTTAGVFKGLQRAVNAGLDVGPTMYRVALGPLDVDGQIGLATVNAVFGVLEQVGLAEPEGAEKTVRWVADNAVALTRAVAAATQTRINEHNVPRWAPLVSPALTYWYGQRALRE